MANQQLTQYIESVQSQGFTETTIREVLLKNGWNIVDINDAFSYLQLSKESLTAGAPIAPGHITPSEHPSPKTSDAFIGMYDPMSSVKRVEYNSQFSAGLAVVLVVAIMILLNKVIDDASYYTTTVNAQLIFDTLIVMPFLLIAFILHESFSGTGKRYLLVSQPYFIVSAVLLVRLLWDTSKYILNTSATYGVYVVLIMIILVLTGSILFVQKYIKAQ